MSNYILGLLGMWIFCDGIISIRIYYGKLAETGGRKQGWILDHSIRLIRIVIGIYMIVVAAP